MSIGTAANAIIASNLRGNINLPEGWTYIGQGAYRRAYMGPDGFVYKVQFDSDDLNDPFDCNRRESMIYAEHGGKTEGFRLAECTFYDCGVIAMEHVDGPPAHRDPLFVAVQRALYRWTNSVELWDCYGNNVRSISMGEVVIVDYAT